MADWSALVKGFQQGSQFSQDFRANRQLEKARAQALERGEYDLESTRAFRQTTNPEAAGVLGEDYAAGNTPWSGQLEDPFAFKLFSWAKSKLGKRKRQSAIDLGGESGFTTSNPVGAGEEEEGTPAQAIPYGEDFANGGMVPYADGGSVEEDKIRQRAAQNRQRNPARVSSSTQNVEGANRTLPKRSALKIPEGVKSLAKGVGKVGVLGTLASGAVEGLSTPTEDYRTRFGLETDDPSTLGDLGVRTLGVLTDVGNAATFGLAGTQFRDKQLKEAEMAAQERQGRQALATGTIQRDPPVEAPVPAAPPQVRGGSASTSTAVRATGGPRRTAVPTATDPDVVNFGDIDIDAREVPDMKTNDWKRYRAEMIAAAQKSGNPQAVAQVNDMVTEMQLKGFMSYGQQGLALQQAGNVRGAMAAYRAAFQYFPNGNDVEFGTNKNSRTGRTQIVAFGKDEETGKVIPGSEMIMDPERVSVLMENFRNPQAFRMWTKDWRDFQQDQREYTEIKKPLAQAQADALANNSEASILRAENAALRGGASGGGASALRNAERVFRERLAMMSLEDETQSDYLASVMSQIKVANPAVPDNSIMQAVMQSVRDGTLEQRLQRMGIGGAPSQQAIPTQ
jgi:hypothetical protein